jgi:hypothetical protein
MKRREFLALGGALAGSVLAGGALQAESGKRPARRRRRQRLHMYRLSLRGRRGSQAAKKHNACMRFATAQAADLHRAHPGDNTRIVRLSVSVEEFIRLFVRRRSLVADLRQL